MNVNQNDFTTALLNPDYPHPEGLLGAKGMPATRRFDVYRNNVAVGLTDALKAGFPVIAKLLGNQNFRAVAGVYLRAHPPRSPLMMHYGTDFPEFLAGFQPLAHLGYLADTARLEQLIRRSYHAADATPMAAEILSSVPPDALNAVQLHLAPSLFWLTSDWPIHAIWRYNSQPNAPKPTAGAQSVLITRPGFDPQVQLLDPGGAEFLTAIHNGASLGDALELATTRSAGFDFAALLGQLLAGGAITDISRGDQK